MEDISLWVSPVVLVSGVGLLIMSTSARYGQLHGELRELIMDMHEGKLMDEIAETMHANLQQRTRLLLSALFSLYLSIGFLVSASLVGVIGSVMDFSHMPVIALTFAGIAGVGIAALQLIRESRIFMHTVDVCIHSMKDDTQ